jgi:hypothetical protein
VFGRLGQRGGGGLEGLAQSFGTALHRWKRSTARAASERDRMIG